MNPLDQYIKLYTDHAATVDAGSAPALNALRPAALSALQAEGGAQLPARGSENYERTDLRAMYAPDLGVNINRVAIPVDVAATFHCDVPNLSTLLGIVVNDAFVPSSTLVSNLPEGVLFCSLRKAAQEHPALVESHYGALAPLGNPVVALNTLLAQDGVMIYVPDGVTVEKPLQLVNIFHSPTPLMAARRVLVVLGKGAKAQILVCDHTQPDAAEESTAYLSSQVIEIFMGEDSSLDYYDIEESSPLTSRHSMVFASQKAGSHLAGGTVTLLNGTTRNDFSVTLDAPGCHTHLAGMAIGSAKSHTDNLTSVRHLAPRCHSNQIYKYVLDDDATGAFSGRIYVDPAAPFTDAYQTNRNILASAGARMHAKPQLEIYNDDVKCSHGATTGQLDSEALFYMQTRGIPAQEARTMLMQAFMTDVIDGVAIEGLRDRLRHLVEKRFQGTLGACATCRTACRES